MRKIVVVTLIIMAGMVIVILLFRSKSSPLPLEIGDRLLVIAEVRPGTEVYGGTIELTKDQAPPLTLHVFEFPDSINFTSDFAAEAFLLSDPILADQLQFAESGSIDDVTIGGHVYFRSGDFVLDNQERFRIAAASWKKSGDSVTVRVLRVLPPSLRMEERP